MNVKYFCSKKLFFAAAISFILSACGGGNNSGGNPSSTNSLAKSSISSQLSSAGLSSAVNNSQPLTSSLALSSAVKSSVLASSQNNNSSKASSNGVASSITSSRLSSTITNSSSAPLAVGVWTNVTPSNVNLSNDLPCGNYGLGGVVVDPRLPSDLYIQVNCQGIWKSTDYGITWTGPINTGTNGNYINGAGVISIADGGAGNSPVLIASFKRDYQGGAGFNGFWFSKDYGVNWTHTDYNNMPAGSGPYYDFYRAVVDPYDPTHLLASKHQSELIIQSTDQGLTWQSIPLDSRMTTGAGSGAGNGLIFFIDTGVAQSTRQTFLYIAQDSGGSMGTWRTADAGQHWAQVEAHNEHSAGDYAQAIYQAGNGRIYMAGVRSTLGDGVLMSNDYGLTWARLGNNLPETNVWGTANNLYSTYGFAVGPGQSVATNFQMAAAPGFGTWAQPSIPQVTQGPLQVAVTNDGKNNIILSANFNGGLWRYVEPSASIPLTVGNWKNITPPGIDPAVNPCTDIQFDPSNHSILYAMFGGGGGIQKSTDAGATWKKIDNLPSPNSLGRILIDPNNSNHMYTTGSVNGNSFGFWVSNDGGSTWNIPAAFQTGASTTWNMDVYNIVVDPTDFNHLLLTFHLGWPAFGNAAGILESLDGGASYIVHNPAPGMDHGQGIAFLYNPALGIGNKNTWLVGAGYAAGLFRTSNAGATWTQVSNLQENHGGFDAHYSSQGFLYIGASDGVYQSKDNGVTWKALTNGVPNNYYYSVIGDGDFLYTSAAFVGVSFNQPFLLTPEGGANEGAAWTVYSNQILPEGPWKMSFDSANKLIYNAAWGGGAWVLKVK